MEDYEDGVAEWGVGDVVGDGMRGVVVPRGRWDGRFSGGTKARYMRCITFSIEKG